jgi:hypothetical protein
MGLVFCSGSFVQTVCCTTQKALLPLLQVLLAPALELLAQRATGVDASEAPLFQLIRLLFRLLVRQVQLHFAAALGDGAHALGQEAVAIGVLQDCLRDSFRRQRNGSVAWRAHQEAFDGEQRPFVRKRAQP